MTADQIVKQLKSLGSASYKKVLLNHGVQEPVFGVKIEDMKKIIKQAGGGDQELATRLFDTGIYDAMYMAGLMADGAKMSKSEIRRWLKGATAEWMCGYIVPWLAAESEHGHELAMKWIDSKKEHEAVAGWMTLSSVVSVTDDADLDLTELRRLLQRVADTIHDQPNRARYAMNNFVIAVGCYVKELTAAATAAAKQIGKVHVDMGNTACKVPDATQYIDKVRKRGSLGKKRQSVKC